MRRDEFVDWLEAQLASAGVPVSRWKVDAGVDDLEIQSPDGKPVRLRIVRTPPTGGERAADAPAVTRPAESPIERR